MLLDFYLDDEEETLVGAATCDVVPRVGETIWLTAHQPYGGVRSFAVVSVAYHMCNKEEGFTIPSHGVAVYVRPAEEPHDA